MRIRRRSRFRSSWMPADIRAGLFRLTPIFIGCLLAVRPLIADQSPINGYGDRDEEKVGSSPDGRTVTPVNQILTPYGKQIDLPGMRPQGLALSADGRLLVT